MNNLYIYINDSNKYLFLERFYDKMNKNYGLQRKLRELLKNTKYKDENLKKPSLSAINQAYIFSNTNLNLAKECTIDPLFFSYVVDKRSDDELFVKSCDAIVTEIIKQGGLL